jgi:hypothetical protein
MFVWIFYGFLSRDLGWNTDWFNFITNIKLKYMKTLLKSIFGGNETTVMERPVQPQKTEQELIEEIHNEFDTAPERILQQALSIISEQQNSKVSLESEIEEKAIRLQNLGFVKNGLVNKLGEIQERNRQKDLIINMEMRMAEGIQYYARTYPFLKFLPVSELDRICDKYGLVYAPVGHYKMPVPDKNLKEIENAQPLKSIDVQPDIVIRTYYDDSMSRKWGYNRVKQILGGNSFTDDEIRELAKKHNIELRWNSTSDFFWVAGRKFLSDDDMCITKEETKTISRKGLFIAAPKDHFDLTGLEFDKKKGYFQTTIQVKKDPIVFRYVKGGIQVLTKWGLEADDPALQMEILN